MEIAELLKIIACPACHGRLETVAKGDGFLCPQCHVVYPIKEDIPVLIRDEAISLQDWEKKHME